MITILHRYVFRELCKVFFLASLALTLILSLGSVLRPIQDYGIGPGQVADLLVYLLPVTLMMVLPIAALFSAALTYGRLATDNEIDACKASGISPLTLIYPGFLLAVLVAIANLLLSFHVTPYFVRLADQSINANLRQIVFHHLLRSSFYRPRENRYAIYADYADPRTDSLYGVIVLKAGDTKIDQIIATEAARVSFNSADGLNEVRITAHNTIQMGLGSYSWLQLQTGSFALPFESPLADSISFKCIDDMKRIQTNLLAFGPIEKKARQVSAQAMTEFLADDIHRTLAAGRRYELAGPAQTVQVAAAGVLLGSRRTIQLTGPVEIEEINRSAGRPSRRWQCAKARLNVEGDTWTPGLSLDVFDAHSVDMGGTLMVRYTVAGLIVPQPIAAKATAPPLLETLTSPGLMASLSGGPSPQLLQAITGLQLQIGDTISRIKAEIHSRLVFGIGCIPMILIGIGLGIIKRGGHLLSAFAISCIPAIILVVAIVSGKQLTKNPVSQGIVGPAIMWAGLGILWLLAFWIYRRLARH